MKKILLINLLVIILCNCSNKPIDEIHIQKNITNLILPTKFYFTYFDGDVGIDITYTNNRYYIFDTNGLIGNTNTYIIYRKDFRTFTNSIFEATYFSGHKDLSFRFKDRDNLTIHAK